MAKIKGARMGVNLGFIEKIMLVDGTILENMQVLYRSPIPTEMQLNVIFSAAAEASGKCVGQATPRWSQYPELTEGSKIFIS